MDEDHPEEFYPELQDRPDRRTYGFGGFGQFGQF